MTTTPTRRAAGALTMLALAAGATTAQAQSYDSRSYDSQTYNNQTYDGRTYDNRTYDNRGYDNRGYDNRTTDSRDYRNDYNRSAYGEPVAPPGYDGRDLPPPPQGWRQPRDWSSQQDADGRYARAAERWARDNCERPRSNAGVGAAVGGVLGALIGNSVSRRGDRTIGTLAGAAVGAAGGAAIGSTTGNATSPGCPPGYTLRRGSQPYEYTSADYRYAAPSWYRPWVQSGDSWIYRPYPYGQWYYSQTVSRDNRYDRYQRRWEYRNGQRGWYDRDGRWHQGG